ncbi:MAG: helix-turn-helix domain-containing protein [Prevotella sp.]|nr:helix-turn-helix domain-containing protein [Prevotella sp.]
MPSLFIIAGLLMLLLSYRGSITSEEANQKRSLMLYFSLMLGMWTGIFLYFFDRSIFYVILPVHVFFVLSAPAALYLFICRLIYRQSVPGFLSFHFLPAAILGILSGVFVLIFHISPVNPEEQITTWLLTCYFLSSLFYFMSSCYRLFKRNLELQSVTPESKPVLTRWIIVLTFLSFLLLFDTAIPIFLPARKYMPWEFLGSTLVSAQFIILIYNLICPCNLIFKDPGKKRGVNVAVQGEEAENIPTLIPQSESFVLKRRDFETLFVKNKLYANPRISSGALVEELGIDQFTFSAFIRETYNMNFRQYLNALRLEEMERLLSLPANAGKKTADLILQSGFGSLRSYQRCKAERQKRLWTKKGYNINLKKDGGE